MQQFTNLENFITNINFLLLFLTMLFYLLQSASFISSKWSFLPNFGIIISNFLQATFLVLRWVSSGHFPLSNLYESLLFLSWVLTSLLVLFNIHLENIQPMTKEKNQKLENNFWPAIKIKPNGSSQNLISSFLGSILTPLILLINTFATFSLPTELKLITSLVPALKSNWLMMHVTLMILSYGALLSGCILAIAFLIVDFFSFSPINFKSQQNDLKLSINSNLNKENLNLPILEPKQKRDSSFELAEILDNLSYRILGLGFPLLTIGILSGAVWANQTWGSYWSWDPKETWALITWFIFAIYLHTRISYGWNGTQSALIAAFGFIIIWICYLGVNLLGKGLHSYGFFL
uniref:Cytochrome c biogenesis protein CcsA n=1 Tax=Tupiella akineta TaxID=160070 RepID=Q3ZJ01_TUPAK|nr:cytochrome c biogenesis protein [Tupiella akineta]AAV80688.1 heme attachment to plastid cytochrome c [Tupiella akineta]